MSPKNTTIYFESADSYQRYKKDQRQNYIMISTTGFLIGIAMTLFALAHFAHFGYSGINSSELGTVLSNGERNVFYPVPKEQEARLVKRSDFDNKKGFQSTRKIVIPSGNRISFVKNPNTDEEIIRNCSVTNISDQYALTSAHCGEVDESVFVHARKKDGGMERFRVGKIEKSLSDRGIDAAIIKYQERIKPEVDKINTDYSSLRVGDALTYNGATTSGSHGRILKLPDIPAHPPHNVSNGTDKRKTLVLSDALVQPGDSGGPIYNSKGELVGIVKLRESSGINRFVSMAEIYRAEEEFFDDYVFGKKVVPFGSPWDE